MKTKLHYLVLVLIFTASLTSAQVLTHGTSQQYQPLAPCSDSNIVNNPSFENYRELPWETNQLNLCDGWSNCNGNYGGNVCGSPDFLSTMGTGYAEIPYWILGYVNPHSGNAMSDICTYDGGQTDYREYISTYFTTPMIVGQSYVVSFYITSGADQGSEYNSNNFGVLFSVDSVTNCTYPISRIPQYNISSVIDTPDWVLYTFQYTADSAYKYITFGNFYTDAQSILIQKLVSPIDPYVVTFLDDISVTGLSGTLSSYVSPANDTILNGQSVTLKAYGGTSYLWSNGATTDSITVTPLNDTSYTVEVSEVGCSAIDTAKIIVMKLQKPEVAVVVASYPNPSNGLITVKSDENIDEIKVVNEMGQVVYEAQPNQNEFSFELKINGLYFMASTSGNKTVMSKLQVSK